MVLRFLTAGGPITRWHGANAKNQSSLRCLVKKFFECSSRTAEQSALLSYLFENKFQKCAKNLRQARRKIFTPCYLPPGLG